MGIAIVLFIIGIVGGFALAGSVLTALGQAVLLPPDQAQAAISSAFSDLLSSAIILGLISGLASVFFLWELLNFSGRALILLSYALGIAIACLVYVLIMAQVGPALASAFASTPPDGGPLLALDSQINSLRLLQAIPSLLAAGAAYIAWSRIEEGEIPKGRRSPT